MVDDSIFDLFDFDLKCGAALTHSFNIGIHPIVEYPNSMAPMRGYKDGAIHPITSEHHGMREQMSVNSSEDRNLAGINTLLRAGEIINRKSRNESSQETG
jgi:hypothetical protein